MFKVRLVSGTMLLLCGALASCQSSTNENPVASGTPSASPSASTPVVSTSPSATAPSASPAGSAPAGTTKGVLSGTREVTIVRVQATEGGVTLDGRLGEADDDSGRQLFVPTPLGNDTYLIKAYGRRDNHPANDEPACWQVDNPGNGSALTVEGAVCDPTDPAQRFTITTTGANAYTISNSSAYLQHSPTRGLILEELGDGPVRSTFRLVDNGPARTPAGG